MACDFAALSAYIDDELTSGERRRIETHLKVCPMCQAELARLERIRTMLAAAVERPAFHNRLMERMRR